MFSHEGFAKTKPPSRDVLKTLLWGEFFLVITTVKTRHVLKRAWQGLGKIMVS